eukprot:2193203-Rhodomonas_salina.1
MSDVQGHAGVRDAFKREYELHFECSCGKRDVERDVSDANDTLLEAKGSSNWCVPDHHNGRFWTRPCLQSVPGAVLEFEIETNWTPDHSPRQAAQLDGHEHESGSLRQSGTLEREIGDRQRIREASMSHGEGHGRAVEA